MKTARKSISCQPLSTSRASPSPKKKCPKKSNDIPSAILLLEQLDLKGKVVTADALHTQHDLARFLVQEKKADYCFTVKDNQSDLKEAIAYLGMNEAFPP